MSRYINFSTSGNSVPFSLIFPQLVLTIVLFYWLQCLEEENTHLKLKLNDAMKDLKHQKDQNIIMHNEVSRVEITLKSNKVRKNV